MTFLSCWIAIFYFSEASRRAALSRSSSSRSNSSLSISLFRSSLTGASVMWDDAPVSTGITTSFHKLIGKAFPLWYLFCPEVVGNDPRMSIPHQAKGHRDDSDLSSL
ncbi:hypothetical protein A2U01_0016799, partial [Trifolium medium]|nr:hypothetical protein [Trifolium medium]